MVLDPLQVGAMYTLFYLDILMPARVLIAPCTTPHRKCVLHVSPTAICVLDSWVACMGSGHMRRNVAHQSSIIKGHSSVLQACLPYHLSWMFPNACLEARVSRCRLQAPVAGSPYSPLRFDWHSSRDQRHHTTSFRPPSPLLGTCCSVYSMSHAIGSTHASRGSSAPIAVC